jgi:poly(3-hydroxyalkanoate) depolymerase
VATDQGAVDGTTDRDSTQTLRVRGLAVRVSVRRARGELATHPPLLLCNGIGADLETLQPLVDALDPDRGVVRFDVPGVGGSPAPLLPYPIAGLASWVGAMMRRLGYERFDVLGLSWGGGVAQQLALQTPWRIRRLVLVATGTGSIMVPAHPRVLSKMVTPRRYRDPAYATKFAPDIYGGSARTDPEAVTRLLHGAGRSRAGRSKVGYYYQLLSMAGWSSLPFLSFITQPTLVMGGDDDPIIPAVNPRMQACLIPGAQLHIYRGGHLGILTEPDDIVPTVERFLRDDRDLRPTPV